MKKRRRLYQIWDQNRSAWKRQRGPEETELYQRSLTSIRKDVHHWTQACQQSQRSKISRHVHSPLGNFTLPEARFLHVHLDIIGPLPSSYDVTAFAAASTSTTLIFLGHYGKARGMRELNWQRRFPSHAQAPSLAALLLIHRVVCGLPSVPGFCTLDSSPYVREDICHPRKRPLPLFASAVVSHPDILRKSTRKGSSGTMNGMIGRGQLSDTLVYQLVQTDLRVSRLTYGVSRLDSDLTKSPVWTPRSHVSRFPELLRIKIVNLETSRSAQITPDQAR
ncbi:hypothetical protein B566_EDAN007299 [Ephemera danica]|nr:hypothetical protein B566_EDAN007299 [Ephemera danica]